MEEMIDFGDGVIMRPATREDIRIVDRNLRELDRKECEVAHDFDSVPEDYPEGIWAILHNGRHVGYGGFVCIWGDSIMSRRRGFYFLSTRHVEAMKYLFVKKSPLVFAALANKMPSYVDTVIAAPIKEYTKSIRWLEKVLGFVKDCEVEFGGADLVIMKKTRGV